jgi:uncharacterized protein (TIGR02466 family)
MKVMSGEIIPLYPIPLYNCFLDLDNNEVAYIKSLEMVDRPDGYISKSRDVLSLEDTPKTYQQLMSHASSFVDMIGYGFDIKLVSSWTNLHNTGDSSRRHIHGNSMLGGVLFLDTPLNTGEFVLFNPAVNGTRLFSTHIDAVKSKVTEYNAEYQSVTPKTGQCLLFPSFLPHTVTENTSNSSRWTIGFNFFASGTLRENNIGHITF